MNDEKIIKEIADETGRIPENWGLPNTVGRVWVVLYLKGDMTQDELRKDLKSSLSSVSQAITLLSNFGLVTSTSKKGRKNIYSASSIQKAKRKQLDYALQFQIIPMRELLGEKLKETTNPSLKEKIGEIDKMYAKMERLAKLMIKLPCGK